MCDSQKYKKEKKNTILRLAERKILNEKKKKKKYKINKTEKKTIYRRKSRNKKNYIYHDTYMNVYPIYATKLDSTKVF